MWYSNQQIHATAIPKSSPKDTYFSDYIFKRESCDEDEGEFLEVDVILMNYKSLFNKYINLEKKKNLYLNSKSIKTTCLEGHLEINLLKNDLKLKDRSTSRMQEKIT